MTLDATVAQIRALLTLAENDGSGKGAIPSGRVRDREALSGRLPRLLLERYELLLGAGRTPAVARIDRGACSGCHVRLPTMLESAARRSPAVHVCPHCRRLLYSPELIGEDSPAPGRERGSREGGVETGKHS